MKNTKAYYLANLFLSGRKFRNPHELRDRFVLFYYYELDNNIRKNVDISTLWGNVYRIWEKS
jgi:hypothetical protein